MGGNVSVQKFRTNELAHGITRLLDVMAKGEQVEIVKHGVTLAALVPIGWVQNYERLKQENNRLRERQEIEREIKSMRRQAAQASEAGSSALSG